MTRILTRGDLLATGLAAALGTDLLAARSPGDGVVGVIGAGAQAELMLRGEHPGRLDSTARTVYAPVGLPWQDLALAWLAYETATRQGIGISVDLLG